MGAISEQIEEEGIFNLFFPNTPFLYPLKTSENRKVFECLQGGRERVHREQMG